MTTDTALALLAEARKWVVANEKHSTACPTVIMGQWGRCTCGFVNLVGRITALLDSGGWMPIETAPKNHLPILVYGPYGQLVAFKDITWAWWPVPASEKLDYTPTRWQPLPPLPKGEIK